MIERYKIYSKRFFVTGVIVTTVLGLQFSIPALAKAKHAPSFTSVTVTGTSYAGDILTTQVLVSGYPKPTLSYQWYACMSPTGQKHGQYTVSGILNKAPNHDDNCTKIATKPGSNSKKRSWLVRDVTPEYDNDESWDFYRVLVKAKNSKGTVYYLTETIGYQGVRTP